MEHSDYYEELYDPMDLQHMLLELSSRGAVKRVWKNKIEQIRKYDENTTLGVNIYELTRSLSDPEMYDTLHRLCEDIEEEI